MTLITNNASCSDCGQLIAGSSETLEEPKPCTQCGGTRRTFGVSIQETVVARDGYRVTNRRAGAKKPHIDDRAGPSFSHSLGTLVHLERIIDRENDRYFERVTNYDSGAVIHHNEEPLSQHFDHGSAKPERQTDGGIPTPSEPPKQD